jgi:U3 small nucleolar RNA-associated protein 13
MFLEKSVVFPTHIMSDLPLWDTRVTWPSHYDDGDVIVVPPMAFVKSRSHCLAIDLETRKVTGKVELDTDVDPVLSFTGDCHDGNVVFLTAQRSSLIKVYKGRELEPVLTFKSNHSGPVISMNCSLRLQRLLTIGVGKDICLKAWDIGANTCLQSIRPLPSKPTTMELAERTENVLLICVGNVEGGVQVYDANDGYKMTLLKKHVSPVSALRASGNLLVSAGRDEVIVLWDLQAMTPTKVVPTFETIENIVFCQGGENFLTGGSKGQIRLWKTNVGKEMDSSAYDEWSLKGIAIKSLSVEKGESGDVLHFVQDDVLFRRPGTESAVFSLNRNEINDMALVKEKYLVVAGNSTILKIYNVDNYGSGESEENCELSVFQTAHEDTIVHLSSWSGGDSNKFVSAGKENHVHVWRLKSMESLKLLYTCAGHSTKITAIRMVGSVVTSSDEHGILKVWLVPEKKTKDCDKLTALKTEIAHQKEVSCLDGCADKQFLVSGSLDKTAKVWDLENFTLKTTLSGHRRGVTAVKISPFERILATGSQDSAIKLWELNGFTCFKTLEGQQSQVLCLAFSTLNMLHSTGNDGVHYVWNIHASAPKIGAFEGHDSQVWSAIARGPDDVVTAGADGRVIFWKNNADLIAAKKEEETKLKVKNDQTLENCILRGKTKKALALALKLERPKLAHVLLITAYEEGTLPKLLDSVSPKLAPRLLDYVMQWNANSRHYIVAQFVQKHYLSKNLDVVSALGGNKETVTKLMAYNEKHSARLAKLNSRFAIVDTLLN